MRRLAMKAGSRAFPGVDVVGAGQWRVEIAEGCGLPQKASVRAGATSTRRCASKRLSGLRSRIVD
jgi:hypothetical protein